MHRPFARIDNGRLSSDFGAVASPPNQLRWDPLPIPATPTDFVQAIVTMAGNGDPHAQAGCGIHLYAASSSMIDRAFYNADGEMLIVPQQGRLRFLTELGIIDAEPHEIVVIPRGVRFRVELIDAAVRGYICENFGAPFRLPDLGVIGSNGLANARDFATPVAWYEDREGKHELVAKFMGNLWAAEMDHSPLDVVAWNGNFAPYKYDLRRFNTVGSISYDHPDPSIFLVLQAQTATPGVDDIDFRHLEAGLCKGHDGIHVRNALRYPADPVRAGIGAIAGRVLPMLAGSCQALRPGPPVTVSGSRMASANRRSGARAFHLGHGAIGPSLLGG